MLLNKLLGFGLTYECLGDREDDLRKRSLSRYRKEVLKQGLAGFISEVGSFVRMGYRQIEKQLG